MLGSFMDVLRSPSQLCVTTLERRELWIRDIGASMKHQANVTITDPCEHAVQATIRSVPRPAIGCEDCLKIGARWVHLRECLSCGHIGCCDQSPNRHATAHFLHTR